MSSRKLSAHTMENIVKESFTKHPLKTMYRLDYFLKRCEDEGLKVVSIYTLRVVMGLPKRYALKK